MTQLFNIYCVYPDCGTTTESLNLSESRKNEKAEKNVGSRNRKTATLGLTG